MKKGMVDIDGTKLAEQIKQRGISFAEVSREIGYASGFINNCIARNQINNSAIKMLNMLYHIQPDDYKIPEIVKAPDPEPEKEPQPTFVADLVVDYQMLFKVIYKAVLEALKKAWEEKEE